MEYFLHVVAHVAVVFILFAVIFWIRRSTSGKAAQWMLYLLYADVVWVLSVIANLLAPMPLKRGLAPFPAAIGIAVTVPWFFFTIHYTGRQDLLTRRRRYVVWGIGLGTAFALVTTNVHSLLWTGYEVIEEPFLFLNPQMAPTVAALYLIAYSFAFGGTILLVDFLLSTRHLSRTQTLALIGGALLTFVINLLSGMEIGFVSGFNYTGLSTGLFGAIIAWSLFNDSLFRVAPVARDTIFESFSDPLIAVDVDTTIVDYNAAARQVLPTIDSCVGHPLSELEPGLLDDENGFADKLTLSVDGEDRSFRIEQSDITAGTRQVGVVIHLRDVTELEAYAAELERRTGQLETKTEQLEEFASSVSHDLRNPINVAKGRIDVAKQTGEDEHLDTADEALDRGLETIDELLALARSGQRIDETNPVDLHQVVEESWRAVDTGNGSLDTDCEGTVVMADRGRLKGLFENLFRNAVEHVGADVSVTVESTDDGFAVGDDGPGVPEDERDQVFQHGYTGSDGTGLGLAKVESIAIAHDWSVSLDESPAGGAQFVFENVTFGDRND